MAAGADLIFVLAPEFETVDTAKLARIDSLIAIASLFVPPNVFGPKTDVAVAYLVAHMLKIGTLAGGGLVTKKKLGDIELAFSAGNVGKDALGLGLTSYGQQFLTIKAGCRLGPFVTE